MLRPDRYLQRLSLDQPARIVAAPGTLTGSIGVVAGKPVLAELWQELGVNWGHAQRGANADMWTTTVNYSPQGRARLEAFLDGIYAAFTEGVARGRDLPQDQVLEVAQGRVWTGAQAKERGLVDALGGFADAMAVTRQEIGLASDTAIELRPYPAPQDLWDQALELALGAQVHLLSIDAWLDHLTPATLGTAPIVIR
jgi:protease-4